MPLQFEERQGEVGATRTWREAGTTFSLGARTGNGPASPGFHTSGLQNRISVCRFKPPCLFCYNSPRKLMLFLLTRKAADGKPKNCDHACAPHC